MGYISGTRLGNSGFLVVLPLALMCILGNEDVVTSSVGSTRVRLCVRRQWTEAKWTLANGLGPNGSFVSRYLKTLR